MSKIACACVNADLSPARVELTPDGVKKKYATSSPPFVKSQTINLLIPKSMNPFNSITEDMNASGSRLASPAIVTPPPKPLIPKIGVGAGVAIPAIPVTPAVGGVAPKPDEVGAAAKKSKTEEFVDDLKVHSLFYGVGTLLGGGVGYFVGNKYGKKWIGAGVGAVVVFGVTWLYFSKYSTPPVVVAPVASTPTT